MFNYRLKEPTTNVVSRFCKNRGNCDIIREILQEELTVNTIVIDVVLLRWDGENEINNSCKIYFYYKA